MNAWLPLIAGLVGTITGGVITHVSATAQWRRQRRTDRNRYLVSKLEELCSIVLEVERQFKRTFNETMSRINPSQLGVSGGLPESIQPVPIREMQLFTALYFETLVPYSKLVVDSRDHLGKHLADSIIAKPVTDKAERQKLSLEVVTEYLSAEAACKAFLDEAARIAKSLL
jgi:hypothetical protein